MQSPGMRFLTRFWAAVGFGLTLFGIFWLPKDMQDWEQAAQPWQRLLAMVDQNTALWVFSSVALAYILWIDARPWFLAKVTKQPEKSPDTLQRRLTLEQKKAFAQTLSAIEPMDESTINIIPFQSDECVTLAEDFSDALGMAGWKSLQTSWKFRPYRSERGINVYFFKDSVDQKMKSTVMAAMRETGYEFGVIENDGSNTPSPFIIEILRAPKE